MPSTKKRRGCSSTIARASLTSLPLELLAEVLLYTSSPPTVLAVSRTCSFLYRTLAQNPAASFIWRSVRKTCKPWPGPPDLEDHWNKTEAEYAAFMFSGGICEVCSKPTRTMYVSFAVRIRLCGSWYCRKKFCNERLVDVSTQFSFFDEVCQPVWVPSVESTRCFRPSSYPRFTWPDYNNTLIRKTELETFQLDLTAYEAAKRAQVQAKHANTIALSATDQERVERCDMAIQRLPAIMELSVRLLDWKVNYDQVYDTIKKKNRTWTEDLAVVKGWDLDDLLTSQTYGSLQSRKNFLLEEIEWDDVASLYPTIESELLAMQVRRKRQTSEAAYKGKLTQVKKIYENIRCGTLEAIHAENSDSSERLILPPLSVFCTLPSVQVLKGSPNPNTLPPNNVGASSDIKSSPLATSLILSDIRTWLIPVQTYLMRLLGYPNGWQSASTRTLPPIKRLTARFFCRRCGPGKVRKGYHREGCLDLKGVCSHVCVAKKSIGAEGKRNGVKTLDWVVDVFEREDKAIRIIRTILELTGLLEEEPATASSLRAKGGIIRCMSCEGWIVMDFDSAIGHAHRHESMEIKLLPMPDPTHTVLGQNTIGDAHWRLEFERGNCALLLGPTYRARHLCKRVNYVCKHCLHVPKHVVLPMRVESKGARRMTFNGLRSHVKKRHGIQDIRDEDFFCYDEIV